MDELNSMSNEEYFSVYPYDSDLRIRYANELQVSLEDYFDDLIENKKTVKKDDLALLFLLWLAVVAMDQFQNEEFATQMFELEFSISSYERSQSMADIIFEARDTAIFNDFILNSSREVSEIVMMCVTRSQTIARNETDSLCNKMLHEAAKSIYTYKRWVAIIDKKTRDAHIEANGQIVPINEPFIVGGEEMMYPHDENASPENTVNCRCHVEYINDNQEDS